MEPEPKESHVHKISFLCQAFLQSIRYSDIYISRERERERENNRVLIVVFLITGSRDWKKNVNPGIPNSRVIKYVLDCNSMRFLVPTSYGVPSSRIIQATALECDSA